MGLRGSTGWLSKPPPPCDLGPGGGGAIISYKTASLSQSWYVVVLFAAKQSTGDQKKYWSAIWYGPSFSETSCVLAQHVEQLPAPFPFGTVCHFGNFRSKPPGVAELLLEITKEVIHEGGGLGLGLKILTEKDLCRKCANLYRGSQNKFKKAAFLRSPKGQFL